LKKRESILILFLSLINVYSFYAQNFHGGSSDGHAFAIYTETQSIFAGGDSDGFSVSNYTETQSVFTGGDSDGFSVSNYTETQSIFTGGDSDGFSVSNYTETQSIFAGGDSDGFSVSNYTETQNIFAGGDSDGFSVSNYTEIQSIFAGGDSDGFSVSNYNETQSIFAGGDSDGFSVSNYNETQSIFAGGDSDGFSMGLFDENPNCSDTVTIFGSSGWTNGIPNNTTQIVINDNYQVNQEGNIDACSCVVKNGKTLKISPNSYVKLEHNLVNNGIVEVQHQGSFVQVNNDATVTGSGTFTTRLQTTQLVDPSRFTYFSSPVQNQDLMVFSSWARMNRLWRFDETIQDWYLVNNTDIMIPAVGYAIQGDIDTGQYPFIGYADFDGAFNNGIYSYPLTYNPGGNDDDNALVGNPYPSAIDAAMLLNNNASANAFYFWTHNSVILADGSAYAGDDYAVWNSSGGIASGSGSPAPTGFIASGQGFFVDATASGNLVFNNAMRVTGNNTDFRRSININRDRIWLNLSNYDGYFNQILINFSENGTEYLDNKLDAVRFNSGNPISFYSNGLDNEPFVIQAVPNLSDDNIIPLGYEVNSTIISNLNISIDHLEFQNDTNVYLKDNSLNIIHDLNQSDYQFTVEQGQFNNRFELIFQRNTLNTNEFQKQTEYLIISNSPNDNIVVKTKNNTIINEIRAFDILGKLIWKSKHNQASNKIYTPNIKQGTILFFKVKLNNDIILTNKFIKL
jgi:hypothetical protein